MRFAFIFGNVWKLSLAEILAYLEKENIKWEFVDLSKKALIIDARINPEKVILSLGGTIKIIKIEKEFDFNDFEKQDFGDDVDKFISVYGSFEMLKRIRKIFNFIPKDGVLNPKQIFEKKKPLEENALIFGLKTCYYGPRVVVISTIDMLKFDKKGTFKTPLSRAIILANLSKAREYLVDLNAGNGIMAYGAVNIGVKYLFLQENDFIEFKRLGKTLNEVRKRRIKITAERNLELKKTDTIAMVLPEGPELSEKISKHDAEKIMKFLEKDYSRIFKQAEKMLVDNGRIAVIYPVFNTKKGKVFANKFREGFKMIDVFEKIPQDYKDYLKIERKMIIDEIPEISYKKLREFCIYEKISKK